MEHFNYCQQEHVMYNYGTDHTQTIADICFVRAEGDYIFDLSEKRYIDFNGTLNLPFGHDRELILQTFNEALPLNAVSYATVPRYELCRKLSELFPNYTAFQFYSAGTEANEGAMRYAMAITGKDGFCAFHTNYHGRTRATASLCNMKDYNGKRLPEYFRINFPYTKTPNQFIKSGFERTEDIYRDLEEHLNLDYRYNCAGLFYEPIQGKSVNIPPSHFYKKIQAVCSKHEVLLIADEYLTALRCGAYSLSEQYGIEPDIMTIGKCLGNGIPFAVLMCHKRHAEKVWRVKGSTTFGGNPFACSVVLKNLIYLEKQQLLKRICCTIEKNFLEIMNDLIVDPLVMRISGKGALLGIEMKDKKNCLEIGKRCLEEGIVVSCIKNTIRIAPSFTIDEEILKNALFTVKEIILRVSMGQENE